MASTVSRTQSEQPQAAGFSYAQAAKGRSASATGSVPQSSQPSGTNTPKDPASAINTPPVVNGVGSHELDRTLNGVTFRGASHSRESDSKSSAQVSSPPSPKTASASTVSKDDETSATRTAASDSTWDKVSQTSTEKTADVSDKSKRAKKSKGADKDAKDVKESEEEKQKEVKQEVLVAAPMPSVNIWHQRKEAFTAKVKPAPVVVKTPTVSAGPNGTPFAPATRKNKDDGERTPGASSPKESKGSKKTNDGLSRSKEDSRRSAPRGSREKDVTSGTQLPPPVEDTMSWPTPETVAEEEKKKTQVQDKVEKEEKDDSARSKRPKDKWVHVPYTPSVTFNTPLPSRGGRGRGGSRAGRDTGRSHATNGSTSSDKAGNAATGTEGRERGRDTSNVPRSGSISESSNRREVATDSKPANDRGSISNIPKNEGAVEAKQTTSMLQGGLVADERQPKTANTKAKTDSGNGSTEPHGRGLERRSERSTSVSEPGADGSKDAAYPNRERGDARSDRGRGAYRGRGGHNSFPGPHNPHAYTNGHNGQPATGLPVRQGNGPFSPPLQQQPHFANPYSRGGRGNSRSQPMSNNMFGRFPPPNGAVPQMAPLQTGGMMDYQGMHPMSAVQYAPFVEQYSVLAMVTMQIEYYFSIDNLCKDLFLRKHMDSQGFVFLNFIADFKRVQALTQDIETLRFACHNSELVEIVQGEDGVDRVRAREGWEKWVVPMEDRDISARTQGPSYLQRIAPHPRSQSMGPRMSMSGQPSMSPPLFSPNGHDANFRAFSIPGPHMNGSNGMYHHETPLSAAVPDFNPGAFQANGAQYHDVETTHTDKEVNNLNLMWRQPESGKTNQEEPTLLDTVETKQVNGAPNHGEASFENKRQKHQSLGENVSQEPYREIRARALQKRDAGGPGHTDSNMKLLYEFWSDFLTKSFNPNMYEEFRRCAFEDALQKQAQVGLNTLTRYYDIMLNSKQRSIPEIFARHYVELVKFEDPTQGRPAFNNLRSSWRNGALDLKSRKKVDRFLDATLRKELER